MLIFLTSTTFRGRSGALPIISRALRNGLLALSAVLLAGAFLPDAASARGGYYAGARGYGFGLHGLAYGAIAVGLGIGLGYGYYGYPLVDSYDFHTDMASMPNMALGPIGDMPAAN